MSEPSETNGKSGDDASSGSRGSGVPTHSGAGQDTGSKPHPTPGADQPPLLLGLRPEVTTILVAMVGFYLALSFGPAGIAQTIYSLFALISDRIWVPQILFTDFLPLLISLPGHSLLHIDTTHFLTNLGFYLAFGGAVARGINNRGHFFNFHMIAASLSGFATIALAGPGAVVIGASGVTSAAMGALTRMGWSNLSPQAPFNNRSRVQGLIIGFAIINVLMYFLPYDVLGARVAVEAHVVGFIFGWFAIPRFLPAKTITKT